MKLPDLPRPQAPRTEAVDMGAVSRIEASTKQKLGAVNQIGNALRSEYGAAMEARDQADRAEAKTRSLIYKNKVDKLRKEEMERMNSLPLDSDVSTFADDFVAQREELKRRELEGVNERVSRHMNDSMLVADAEADLQAAVAAREQLTARTFHFTAVAHNAASNEIYDFPNDTFYEGNIQRMGDDIEANLTGMDSAARAKYQRDMNNDYTEAYVWGLVAKERIHEALRFLDKDPRSDQRLYDQRGLRAAVVKEGEVRAENAKTMINYLFSQYAFKTSVTGGNADSALLRQHLNGYTGMTLEQRQWKEVMERKLADMEEWAKGRAAQGNLNNYTNAGLDALAAETKQAILNGSKEQAELHNTTITAIAEIRNARRTDFPQYAIENYQLTASSYGEFTKAFTEALQTNDFGYAATAYAKYAEAVRNAAMASGEDPYLLAGTKFEVLPKDSQIAQLASDWLDKSTGPQETVRRITAIDTVFGNADSTSIIQKSKNSNDYLAIKSSDNPERTAQGRQVKLAVGASELEKASLLYTFNAPSDIYPDAQQRQINYEYAMLAQDKGITAFTIVDPGLMKEAVWRATGLMENSGVLSLSPYGVGSYPVNGAMVEPYEFGQQFRRLTSKDGSDWSQYTENGKKGPYREVIGGRREVDPLTLAGKIYPRVTETPGVYFIMTKGGGLDGGDGYLTDRDGRHLRIDFRKIVLPPMKQRVPSPERQGLRDAALTGQGISP